MVFIFSLHAGESTCFVVVFFSLAVLDMYTSDLSQDSRQFGVFFGLFPLDHVNFCIV